MKQVKLASLLAAMLATASAWQPMKPIFDIPFATFPDDNCGLPPSIHDQPMQNVPAANMRDGICVRQGQGTVFGSFAYGRPHYNKKDGKKLDKLEKKYPQCTIEVYDQDLCGGPARHYKFGENMTEATQLPGMPIYVVHDAMGEQHEQAKERLRKCYSLKDIIPKKGKSALMSCNYVTSSELPPCKDKRVIDDQKKGLYRACYKD